MEEKRDIETKLAVSLKGLVTKIPFEKITIKQIADGAGVIRVTFYNHFQDKYDLLAWIVRREILDPVRILISNRMYRESCGQDRGAEFFFRDRGGMRLCPAAGYFPGERGREEASCPCLDESGESGSLLWEFNVLYCARMDPDGHDDTAGGDGHDL